MNKKISIISVIDLLPRIICRHG